jgi:hypothetical protein
MATWRGKVRWCTQMIFSFGWSQIFFLKGAFFYLGS